MNKFLVLAIAMTSFGLSALHSRGYQQKTTLVTPAFLNELNKYYQEVDSSRENKQALEKFKESLSLGNISTYETDRDEEAYLEEGIFLRFESIEVPPFKSLFVKDGSVWNQSRSATTAFLAGVLLKYGKYTSRLAKGYQGSNSYKGCKIWTFSLERNSQLEHYVWCERGLFIKTRTFTNLDPQAALEHENVTEMSHYSSEPAAFSPSVPEYGIELPDLFLANPVDIDDSNLTEKEFFDYLQQELAQIGDNNFTEQPLRQQSSPQNVMPNRAYANIPVPPIACPISPENSSFLHWTLEDLLAVLGPEMLITYIQNLEKENEKKNNFNELLKPKKTIQKNTYQYRR